MTNIFFAAFGWVTSHLKLILITSAIVCAGWLVLNYASKIEEAASLRQVVEVQAQTIAAKDKVINGLVLINNANNRAIDKRDADIEALTTQLDGITDNLGDDSDDIAPESLQELMRRLNR